jgi:hypothetical protein
VESGYSHALNTSCDQKPTFDFHEISVCRSHGSAHRRAVAAP